MAESTMRIQHHLAPGGLAPGNGYSHAVVATGRVVAIAGQVAMDESGELVGADRPPASTAVQVAALFRPGFVLEVEALALIA